VAVKLHHSQKQQKLIGYNEKTKKVGWVSINLKKIIMFKLEVAVEERRAFNGAAKLDMGQLNALKQSTPLSQLYLSSVSQPFLVADPLADLRIICKMGMGVQHKLAMRVSAHNIHEAVLAHTAHNKAATCDGPQSAEAVHRSHLQQCRGLLASVSIAAGPAAVPQLRLPSGKRSKEGSPSLGLGRTKSRTADATGTVPIAAALSPETSDTGSLGGSSNGSSNRTLLLEVSQLKSQVEAATKKEVEMQHKLRESQTKNNNLMQSAKRQTVTAQEAREAAKKHEKALREKDLAQARHDKAVQQERAAHQKTSDALAKAIAAKKKSEGEHELTQDQLSLLERRFEALKKATLDDSIKTEPQAPPPPLPQHEQQQVMVQQQMMPQPQMMQPMMQQQAVPMVQQPMMQQPMQQPMMQQPMMQQPMQQPAMQQPVMQPQQGMMQPQQVVASWQQPRYFH
jgi:hypothetical protein